MDSLSSHEKSRARHEVGKMIGNAAATIGFPSIGLQRFATRKVKGVV
jgi:hypothetical protein